MGDVVNLKRVRKLQARESQEVRAEANRMRHGRPGAERRLEEARAELEARRLDSHNRSE